MVCDRCILVVREHLVALGLTPARVELGEAEVLAPAAAIDWPQLRHGLARQGFELLDQLPPTQRLVAQIKALVAELLTTNPAQLRSGQFSQVLSQRLQRRFAYLSSVFSATEGQSLTHYVGQQRLAAARRLLATTQLPVSHIARQLGFSNLGHLSHQFQQATGVAPTAYRRAHGAAE